jgi:uncharacterized membrane protein
MAEPKSTLKDVVEYLKNDEDAPGTDTPLAQMKELSDEDRRELRESLDKVRGL